MAAKEAQAMNNGEIKTPLTQDEAFAILQAGGNLEDTKQSAVYEARYNSYKMMSVLASSSLADLNASGDLNQNALEYLKKVNPEKYLEVQRLTDDKVNINNINQSNERLYNAATGKKKIPDLSTLDKIAQEEAKIIY
jgi:hypothetical protein